MKKIKSIILISALILMAGSAAAQNKLGYMNSNEVLYVMPEMEEVQKKLEAYRVELAETFEAMQTEYTTKVTEYQQKSPDWTESMQNQKAKEINSLRESIQEFNDTAQNELAKKQQELMDPVFKKIREAIDVVGKENGFTYIFDTSIGMLVYIDEANAINIEELVRTKLGIKK